MKLLFGLCLSLVFVLGTVAQSASLTAEIAELPTCALSCLVIAIEASPCTATNQTCICTDATLQANVTGCVTLSCTLEEALVTKNVTSTACGVPIRDKRVLYTILNDTFAVLSGVIVGIRLVSKFWLGSSIGMDDYFIAITLLVGMPSSAINVHGLAANGLGKDIWTLTPAKITSFVYYFYIMEILYFTQVALLKISILFFYQRIFPAPAIKKLIWGTIAFDAVFGVTFLFISIFQCRPISYYWKKWDGLHEGSCFNVNGIGWANAAISILLDAWMIVLPMSQLVHLQLHWKKKIGVAMMFVVGTFVTVISILRLQSLVAFQTSTNPTWDNWAVANWSTLEINIGIICACMPSLRVLLVHLFPNQMGTTKKSSSKYYGTGSRLNTAGNSSTIGRSKKVRETDEDGILRSQSYTVEYGNNQWGDRDETRLVQMTDLDSKSGARTGEREI